MTDDHTVDKENGMGMLDGRVCVVTGAARGLGREYALLFAAEGGKVVVNDLGSGGDGTGADKSAAQEVVDEITSRGGAAVANTDSVADWDGAKRIIQTAIDEFGDLHVLVNNAGILRDRMLVNMGEEEWDAIMNVHLRGTFCPTRHAAAYWRERSKAIGGPVDASVICTSSSAGLHNNVGQANYGAAKAGIAAFGQIVAKELARYGVRVNTVAPGARTRLTLATSGLEEEMASPQDADEFDLWDPANVAPLIACLASADCPATGAVWHVMGGQVGLLEGWRVVAGTDQRRRRELDELTSEISRIFATRARDDGKLISEGHTLEEAQRALTPAG